MDTPAQDYLAVRGPEVRAELEDEWDELETMAWAMDAALAHADDGPIARLLLVLTLGQLSQELRLRVLANNLRAQ